MIKAAAYLHENHGTPSLSEQQARVFAYAKQENLELVDCYEDDLIGVMASAPHLGELCSRAGLTALLDEADHKGWLFVVTDTMERIQRTDVDFDPLEELRKAGKRLVVVGEPLGIPQDPPKPKRPSRRKCLTVAERLLRGRERGARNGFHQSGQAPYGYRRDCYGERLDGRRPVRLVLNTKESEIVRLIFREYLRRKSMKRLIEWLTAQGSTTRRGKKWSRAGVSWILKNETYLGRVHFGKIRSKGKHPAIISPIIFNKVQKLIRKNDKRGGRAKVSSKARRETR